MISRPTVCWLQMRGLKWSVHYSFLKAFDVLFSLFVVAIIFLAAATFLSISLYQVLQRKTEEAFSATKRLREMIEARKVISNRSDGQKT